MKRLFMFIAFCTVVALMVTVLADKLYPQQEQELIGVVDLLKITKIWKKWDRLNEIIQKDKKIFERKLEELAEEVVEKEKELRSLKKGSPEYQKTEKEYALKGLDFKNYSETESEKLKKKAEQFMLELVENMEKEIKSYGRVHDYKLIIKKQEVSIKGSEWAELHHYILNKSVMFYIDKIDITENIAKILDKKYK